MVHTVFLLDKTGLGNLIFAVSILKDYMQTKGIFCVIAFLPITSMGLTVVVRTWVGKEFPDSRQNVKKIEFIRGKGPCQNSRPTS